MDVEYVFTVHAGSSEDFMSAFVCLFWSFHDALPVDGDKKSVSSHFVLISLYCSSAEIKAVQGRRRVILDEIHYVSREC